MRHSRSHYSSERGAEAGRRHSARVRALALAHYGPHCSCCGEWRDEFLGLDHVDGKRSAHDYGSDGKPIGGVKLYAVLRRLGFPPGYQVLCHNCNLSRGFYGYCPHTRKNH